MIETSIIIRTKNEDRWILKCINKLKEQTYKNFEIIIIDNNSNDRTVEIAKKFKIKVYKINKYFPGKALNLGVSKTNSKFIVCLSAHCIPENIYWLKNLIRNFKDKKVAAVYGRQLPMFNTKLQDYRDLKYMFGPERKVQTIDNFFHNANSAIRSSILKKYSFDDKITNIEDRVWSKKILNLKKGYKIIYEPKAAVFHFHGLQHSKKSSRLKNLVNIIKSLEDEKLTPDEFKLTNSKIYCVLLGKIPNLNKQNYFSKNYKLIKDLYNNELIEKILVISEKSFLSQIYNYDDKIIKIKKNIKISKMDIRQILQFVYKKIKKNRDIDYLIYLNLDYQNRPKNFINNLIKKTHNEFLNIVTYSHEIKSNLFFENQKGQLSTSNKQFSIDKKKKYIRALYGLGSVFYFNFLKTTNYDTKKIKFINLKNEKYQMRFTHND